DKLVTGVQTCALPIYFTPRLRRQPSVLAQSAPVEKFSNLVVPSAIPPSMAYRCEMDLSPGRRTEPESPLAGRITMSLDCMRFLQIGRASCRERGEMTV